MARRSLWPREHGAYFQLTIPLVTAYALRPPGIAMEALTAAACLAFLANEPLLVVLGHRGPRVREALGRRARAQLAALGGSAAALGVAGLALAPGAAVVAAAIVALPVIALVGLAWRKAEHTAAGEMVAAVALTGAVAPVLAAAGVPLEAALAIWLGWSSGFAATVLAVRRVIARHRRPASAIDGVLATLLVGVAAGAGLLGGRMPALAIAAPLAGLAALLVISPPPARRLRTIGVAIVIVAAGSGAVAVLAGAA